MTNVIMFYDEKFPFSGPRPVNSFWNNLDHHIQVVKSDELSQALDRSDKGVFIHLHGSYFPKESWKSILHFLKKGNGLIHAGGAPFKHPCCWSDGEWHVEREQTAYHQELNIHEALPVDGSDIREMASNPDIPIMSGSESLFTINDTCNFIMHPTKSVTNEDEMGSVGPMDATIYPLIKGVTSTGRETAAPSVLIENVKGIYSGARWVFINHTLDESFWNEQGARLLEKLAHFVGAGVVDVWLKTTFATYHPGERATIYFQHQDLTSQNDLWNLTLTVKKEGETLYRTKKTVPFSELMSTESFTIPEDIQPGFYDVTCELNSESGEQRVLHQGYWGMDHALLSEGTPLTYGRDYFEKDGHPMPIVGMTYMTSDVARNYLFLPNPHLWDRDMRHMKQAGINYLRTGIWTAWRQMMFSDGHMEEDVLRAIDAFILCAKKHDLHVTFNFFSFTPELWEGKNPYLDPRSIQAQKRFITAVVSRHKNTTNVDWDLINEPTMFDPDRIFDGPVTNHDAFERKAYQTWLEKRHGSIHKLQESWNMNPVELPSFHSIEPPEMSDINFSIRDMIMGKRGMKWLDYVLFTMDMHNQWAADLVSTIKKIAPNQLVTVGQDEALGAQRPSPFFYGDVVDYTSNHTWWLLDDLLWDGIFTKTLNKPNLIQETGIMYVEKPDNHAKRSEHELRNILERKYAYAFSTGGAGAVQWLWNTNYYMNNVNESNIGAIRADGTEKPETDVSYDFGAFMQKIGHLFQDRKLEDVAVVFPYSNDFSNRKLAYYATTNLTRTLAYDMNIPFRAMGEYQLNDLESAPPQLLIVPSPHNFSSEAFTNIIDHVKRQGTTVLFTGPIHVDEYWRETDRASQLFGNVSSTNVEREDMLDINGTSIPVTFGGDRIADTMRGVTSNNDCNLQTIDWGEGKIIWNPLPIEMNSRSKAMIELYKYALEKANVTTHLKWLKANIPGIYGRKLEFKNGSLYIFVSEFTRDTEVLIEDPVTVSNYSFTLESGRIVMFATDTTGNITDVYRPDEITVAKTN
ncbi:MAG TPA: beta-galactosidase [Virgibacillus sp.]|nr:beta-galactosidase [Virgibacillus sp.]